MRVILSLLPIAFVFSLSTAALSVVPEAKVGPALTKNLMKSPGKTFSVLIYLKAKADLNQASEQSSRTAQVRFVYDQLRNTALTSQKDLVQLLSDKKLTFQRFHIANMIAVEGATAALVNELAKRDDVERVIGNPSVAMRLPTPFARQTSLQGLGVESSLSSIGATKVWEEFNATGEGIVVAGQDTGVEFDHPALLKHYRGYKGEGLAADHNYNWHDSIRKQINTTTNSCGFNMEAPCDDNDHGSHTMGTMVGSDGGENKIGMAPSAQWMACRNMDAGMGRPSTYLECFEYFLAPYPYGANAMVDGDPAKAPHVMNNSWGCPSSELCDGSEFVDALKALHSAGVMVVASAGNEGPECETILDQPASISEFTFGVGSFSHVSGKISSFSSRGPSLYDAMVGPDVAAPGENIRSSVPGGTYAKAGWSGTSMAGPHVVGAIALLWSADKRLIGKIDETAALLRATATPKKSTQTCGKVDGKSIPNNTWGYGVIDIYTAVKKQLAVK